MTTTHTFTATDDFVDQRNGNENHTMVAKTFIADTLDDLVHEFTNYLWNLGFTYVDHVEVVTDK